MPILIGYLSGCSGGEDVIEDAGDVVTDVGGCSEECGSNASCIGGVCVCSTGYGNCNNDWSDGCEVNVTNNVSNCGSCWNICDVPNANERCINSGCVIDSCNYPYGDCDGQYDNGCEVNLNTDVNHCGDCSTNCNAHTICVNNILCTSGSCGYDSCSDSRCIDANGIRTDGCELWDYFPKTYGGGSYDYARSIQQTTDGGYIVAGYTDSFGAGNRDFWVLKLNSDGSVDGYCPSGIGAAVTNPIVGTTSVTPADTTATVNTTSATANSTSATVQDTSATTNMQCTMP